MKQIVKLVITAIAALLTSKLLPGVIINDWVDAVLLAAILALFNTFLKPIIVVLTIPVTIVSLGLFLLVINAGLVMLADYILPGFAVSGFWTALFFSIILTIITWLLEAIFLDKKKVHVKVHR